MWVDFKRAAANRIAGGIGNKERAQTACALFPDARALAVEVFFQAASFRLAIPAKPSMPLPSRSSELGSGVGDAEKFTA